MTTIERPPVRYSVSQDDFSYEIGRRLRIFVDGVEQEHVVEYDCEAGTLLKNKLDDNGRHRLNEKRDEIVRETLRGVVTVEWRD